MVDFKNKINFDNICQLLVEADTRLGIFLLKEPKKKNILFNWFYKCTLIRHIVLYYSMMISTLVVTKFSLISVVFCASLTSVAIGFLLCLYNICILNKGILMNLVGWCEGIYDVKRKFHPMVQNLAEIQLVQIEKQATKVLKIFRNIMYFDCSIVTFGFFVVGLILPESIIPKYTPPAPFYLPFKSQDNWTAFLVTTAYQTIMVFDMATIIIYTFSIFLTVVIHILGYLDLIDEIIKRMGREMELRSKTPLKSKLDLDLLKSINDSLNDENNNKKNEISFEEWIKVISEMISDVNGIITKLSNFYSIFCLSIEMISLGSLFICGLIITVIHQQYVYALGVTIGVVFLWIICYANEKIFDKFEDIKAALYDIPWYDLEVKQQKTLLIALNCDEIQKGFTAAGIHDLTVERFGIVIKAGYTNLLVLKDLVQK